MIDRLIRQTLLLAIVTAGIATYANAAAPKLRVSDDKHYLVKDDGSPFFYLGDTAWELFHRLKREEADTYLRNRAEKKFTVVQGVVLAELDGLNDPNAYGHTPLANNDPTKPNEDYFKHVDWIVDRAEQLNLFVGMLPTWGDKWFKPVGQGGIFTVQNARVYGEFLGKRYKEKPIIWIVGGDRDVTSDEHRAILAAMAEGLRAGDGGNHLITFHPRGGHASSEYFHDQKWLDFNMWQNGHADQVNVWDRIGKDFARQPTKPVLDAEPLYEDHPIAFKASERGTSNAADVRRFLYWNLFSGACGHTYGNHAVWQMYAEGRKPVNGPLMPWQQAIDRPGAAQMQYGRLLMESRPYLTRVPDQSVLALKPSSGVNAGLKRIQATRSSDGAYAFVYVPASRTFTVDMTKIAGGSARALWYDPRTGKSTKAGEFPTSGQRDFTPPDAGENIDWILVLDDATKNFDPPGASK